MAKCKSMFICHFHVLVVIQRVLQQAGVADIHVQMGLEDLFRFDNKLRLGVLRLGVLRQH